MKPMIDMTWMEMRYYVWKDVTFDEYMEWEMWGDCDGPIE